MTSRKKRPSFQGYIHGFDSSEQRRLVNQAELLEKQVYEGIDFAQARRILEVGCGVGAQTKILLRRFPKLKIDSVDLSATQLATAREYLKDEISDGRVRLFQANASDLSCLGKEKYDGAFLCWFLEHVPVPVAVLKETRKRLRTRAKIFLTEVFNQTFFVDPPSKTIAQYWLAFNMQQINMGGDPNAGVKLGGLLNKAGYRNITLELRSLQYDRRDIASRKEFIDYFKALILSGASTLIDAGLVPKASRRLVESEFKRVARSSDSIIHLAFHRAVAEK